MKIPKTIPIREADVQDAIVQRLEIMGFTVMITSRQRKKCRKCGEWSTGGDGVSKGLSDLIVTHHSWPMGMAFMLEVKGPTTRLSPEQTALEANGRILIARDQDMAAVILTAVHQRMLAIVGKQ